VVNDIKKNSLRLDIFINPVTEAVDLEVTHNIDLDENDGENIFYIDMLNGIVHDLKINMEGFAVTGGMLRQLSDISKALSGEDFGSDFVFEPDQALMDAIEENKSKDKDKSNVIKLKPKDRIH
tara:strand:- start:531 stop:899 length:369 start_codon:yes stop_codon:yes gene_type:complete